MKIQFKLAMPCVKYNNQRALVIAMQPLDAEKTQFLAALAFEDGQMGQRILSKDSVEKAQRNKITLLECANVSAPSIIFQPDGTPVQG